MSVSSLGLKVADVAGASSVGPLSGGRHRQSASPSIFYVVCLNSAHLPPICHVGVSLPLTVGSR